MFELTNENKDFLFLFIRTIPEIAFIRRFFSSFFLRIIRVFVRMTREQQAIRSTEERKKNTINVIYIDLIEFCLRKII